MGNAIVNGSSGRPILWRDYDWPGHPFPVTLNKITGGAHTFVATSEDPGANFGGLNDAGLAMFNTLLMSLAKPGSPAEYEVLFDCGSTTKTDYFSPDQAYTVSNHAGYIDDTGTSDIWYTTGTLLQC